MYLDLAKAFETLLITVFDLLIKKLIKMMYTLRNLNKVLELPKLRQVYLALVESIIAYGLID